MRLALLLSWPYVRKHRLRTLLTLAGIVLGVAVFVGMHTGNRAVRQAFRRTVDRLAGATQLQISAGESGFPEDVLEKVQSLGEVRAAAPVIEAAVKTGLPGQGSLLILGVDMTGDRSLREYDLEQSEEEVVEDPLVFLAQPDSLIVSRQFADRNGLAMNSRIRLDTMEGPKQFTVRGIMRASGLASAFGGNLAVMDIYAAQAVFGRGRMFDRIDVGVTEGVTVEQCRRRLEETLGPGFQVEPPASRGAHFDSMARSLAITVNITSLFALIVGVFIIYNSFVISITERRPEIGILRALGATRRQVLGVYLMESALGGIAGSALGVVVGLVLARGVTAFMSRLVADIYGTPQWVEQMEADPGLPLAAFAAGVLASLLGGALPARAAARADPVKALQKGRYQVLSEGENRIRRVAALALFAIAAACLQFGRTDAVFYSGYVLSLGALLLLAPALALWLARLLRPLLKWLRPVEGALAADSLIQSPRRTSATVSALMLSLALAVGFAGVSASIHTSLTDWIDTRLNPDLFVTPSESITAREFRFPASMESELQSLDGIDEVQAVRTVRVMVRGKPVMAVAIDIESLGRRVRFDPVEGNREEMIRLAAQGQGAILSDSMTLMHGLHRGDVLEVASPSGLLRLPVLGTNIDYSDQQGSFLIDRTLFTRHWKDDSVNIFRIYLKKTADAAQVRRTILERYAGHRRLFVMTNAELRSHLLRMTSQWLAMTNVQLAVAVLVAMFGIINTLTVSITDRRRELGVLQAVGALRGQVRHTVWMEAAAIGLIGLGLGVLTGAVNAYYNLAMLGRDVAGLRLEYQVPAGFALLLAPVILGAALLGSLWPAEVAVRSSLVESLEYE